MKKLILLFIISIFFYSALAISQESSPTDDDVLAIMNANHRIASYFGAPIQSDQLAKIRSYVTNSTDEAIEKEFSFIVNGSKKSETVLVLIFKDKTGMGILSFTTKDKNENKKDFIKLALKTNVYENPEELSSKSEFSDFNEIVDKVLDKNGYFILVRSKENNDFMQTIGYQDQDKKCLLLEYSEGYTKINKQIFRADNECLSKDEVFKLLLAYASGKDDFKKEIQWNQLKKIEGNKNKVTFKFR